MRNDAAAGWIGSRGIPAGAALAAVLACLGAPPRPVDQGVADRDPLSASLRLEPVDHRSPILFERVYRLEDVMRRGDAFAGGRPASGFVRFDAGIAAVFSRSEYTEYRGGLVAEVPPGTVYHIGLRPDREEAPAPSFPTYNAVDLSARGPSALNASSYALNYAATAAAGAAARSEPVSIWSDEATRRARLVTLIDSAGGR